MTDAIQEQAAMELAWRTEAKAADLKPEDRALILKTLGVETAEEAVGQDMFTTDEVVRLIEAARAEGLRSPSGGGEERLDGPGCPYCGGEGCVQVGSPEAWTWEPCDKCGGDIAPTSPSTTGEVGGVDLGCDYCRDGDPIPPDEDYWKCPRCDAEWYPNDAAPPSREA